MGESTVLIGATVVIARAAEDCATLCQWLHTQGARGIPLPVIRQVAAWNEQTVHIIQHHWGVSPHHEQPDVWLVFASRNGVRFFSDFLTEITRDLALATQPWPAHIKVAAIGSGTAAAVASHGRTPDFVARVSTGAHFAAELAEVVGPACGQIMLLPCAEEGRDALPHHLHACGYAVERLTMYRTLVGGDGAPIDLPAQVDFVLVTSPSSVRGMCAWAARHQRRDLLKIPMITMGPTTTESADEMALQVVGEACPHDESGLKAALLAAAAKVVRNGSA